MNTILTIFELASRSESDLQGLLRQAFNDLAQSSADTAERRATLASIENIQRVLNERRSQPKPGR